MYKVLTENGEYSIGFTNGDGLQAGDTVIRPLMHSVDSGYSISGNEMDGYVIQKDGKTYKADILKVDYKEKTFLIKVNGRRIQVKAADRFDQLLAKLGMSEFASKKINHLKSPMPGLVLDILVSAGQSIKTGEPMLILEAMKMENILKAPGDVTIKHIKALKGKAVEKNELLIEFE